MRVLGDRWLPRPSTFKVLSPIPPHLEGLLVKDLIDVESMSWWVEALHQLFFNDPLYLCDTTQSTTAGG